MKTQLFITIFALSLALATPAYASEVTGSICTGLNCSIEATVIVSPTASPVAGSYASIQSVSLSAAGSSSIRYTTNGTTPTCSSGTLYSGSVSVGSSQTIRAISCYANGGVSSVVSFSYTITVTTTVAPSTQAVTTGAGTITVDIPTGTTVTGNSNWDGIIAPPTATTTTVTISGFTTTVTSAIAIGSSDSDLTFDKAVKLTFAGQAGANVGWYNNAGTFTVIGACSDSTNTEAAQTASLGAGASCKMTVGSDLVVWTKHFSTFTTYTQTVIPTPPAPPVPSGGGGGGGGDGSVSIPVTVTPIVAIASVVVPTVTLPQGQVLGAAKFNFVKNLMRGTQGVDVTELQKALIAAGFDIPAITKGGVAYGAFGGQTLSAVIAFQKARGIMSIGFVGPLTRAELNKGGTPATSQSTQTGSGLTGAQVTSILGLLQSFNADASVIDNVRTSLGR